MFEQMCAVFDNATVAESAYTEVIISAKENAYAIEALVGEGEWVTQMHAALLARFGLSARQVPLLRFGPGLKGKGLLLID